MHNTDISTDDAIQFIRRNRRNPFFLYLAYDAPHEPFIIDDTHWYDNEDWDMNTKRYAALITHMDAAVGRVMKELDRLGLSYIIGINSLLLSLSRYRCLIGGVTIKKHE